MTTNFYIKIYEREFVIHDGNLSLKRDVHKFCWENPVGSSYEWGNLLGKWNILKYTSTNMCPWHENYKKLSKI